MFTISRGAAPDGARQIAVGAWSRRRDARPAAATWSRLACAALLVCAARPALAAAALRIAAGSVARSEVVALGRDLVIEGEALRDVAVVNGDARIEGRVQGDLIVLGGSARLTASARIEGDVFAVGGAIETATGAEIAGRAVAYPSIGAAWLTLLEGPSLGLSATSPVVVAAKLALLTAWLALALALLAVSGRGVLATSELVRLDAARSFVTGLTAVLALFLTALALVTFVPGVAGVPLLLLVLLFGVLLKLWGMVAVFHAVGAWAIRTLGKRRPQPLNAATLGLLLLGAIKLIPFAGILVWWLATFVGIGVALASKFGRREPWLEPGASAGLA
jgi:hypothetical protein